MLTISSLYSVSFGGWSRQRDSNPPYLLGRQRCYRYIMTAYASFEACCVISDLHAFRSLLSLLRAGRGNRNRTGVYRGQNPVPFRLAIPPCIWYKNSQNSFLLWLSLFTYASLPISRRISRIFSRSSRVSALASISSSSSFSLLMHSCRDTFISRLLSGERE